MMKIVSLFIVLFLSSSCHGESVDSSAKSFAQESLRQAEEHRQEALDYLSGSTSQPEPEGSFLWSTEGDNGGSRAGVEEEIHSEKEASQALGQVASSSEDLGGSQVAGQETSSPPAKITMGKVCRSQGNYEGDSKGCSQGEGRDSSDSITAPKFKQKSAPKSEVIVFVSFSIPDESLRVYGAAAQKIGGRVVIRGLIGDSFKQTQQRLLSLGIELEIDPVLFTDHGVTQVPTIVWLQEGTETDRMKGHVALDYALEEFAAHGNEAARIALAKLRGEGA